MSAEGVLLFGTLNLSWIIDETENVEIFSTPYILYDGRTIVAGVSEVSKSMSLRGVAKGEGFITDITDEVSNRHNITLNEKFLGYGQITSFGYSYMSTNDIDNYYRFNIGLHIENLS